MKDMLPRTKATLMALAARHQGGTEAERYIAGILYALCYAIEAERVTELDRHIAPLAWQWIDAEKAKRTEMKETVFP